MKSGSCAESCSREKRPVATAIVRVPIAFPHAIVVRRVANHVDRRGLELEPMFFPRSVAGKRAELIAIVMIVGKGPEFRNCQRP